MAYSLIDEQYQMAATMRADLDIPTTPPTDDRPRFVVINASDPDDRTIYGVGRDAVQAADLAEECPDPIVVVPATSAVYDAVNEWWGGDPERWPGGLSWEYDPQQKAVRMVDCEEVSP